MFELAGGQWVQQSKFRPNDLGHFDQFGYAVDLDGDVALVWANFTHSGGGAAYSYAVSGPDCNANGKPDACDIWTGTSADENADGIPDECQYTVVSYCTGAPNSAGLGARMSAVGFPGVSQNQLVLRASGCPPHQPGLFYCGPSQVGLPFGDGFRCIGGQVFRLPIVSSDGQGRLEHAFDVTDPPRAAGQIDPGESWNFQFWYRDPLAGGSGYNLSDALAILFCN